LHTFASNIEQLILPICLSIKEVEGSGGFRNLERGVQPLARKAHPEIVGLPRPLPVMFKNSWKSELNILKQL